MALPTRGVCAGLTGGHRTRCIVHPPACGVSHWRREGCALLRAVCAWRRHVCLRSRLHYITPGLARVGEAPCQPGCAGGPRSASVTSSRRLTRTVRRSRKSPGSPRSPGPELPALLRVRRVSRDALRGVRALRSTKQGEPSDVGVWRGGYTRETGYAVPGCSGLVPGRAFRGLSGVRRHRSGVLRRLGALFHWLCSVNTQLCSVNTWLCRVNARLCSVRSSLCSAHRRPVRRGSHGGEVPLWQGAP